MTDIPGQFAHRWVQVELLTGAEQLGQRPSDAQLDKLAHLLEELERWNRRINLTAIRDVREMIDRHALDSMAALPLVEGRRVLDVGTGGGFPGLPVAILAPDKQVTLLDSVGKKIGFVRHMIGELGLTNAEAVHSRVEDHAPAERYDTVMARAFAALPRIVSLAGHLVTDAGRLLALKGQYPAAELEELGDARNYWNIDVTELNVPNLPAASRHAVMLRRRVVPLP